MNNKTMYILIALGIVLIIWFLYSWLSVRNIEEPKYSVVSKADGYEIRQYSSYILAETVISSAIDRDDAVRKGFPVVAGYIFGDNTKKDKIAMTAPVNTEKTNSEKIAMTVPVNTEQAEKGSYKVSFVLPSEYTMDTLPTPNDSRVRLVEVPSRKVAVKRFTWIVNETRLRKNEESLLASLKRDGVVPVGAVNVARYNPPWTLPFMLRNEVQVDVK